MFVVLHGYYISKQNYLEYILNEQFEAKKTSFINDNAHKYIFNKKIRKQKDLNFDMTVTNYSYSSKHHVMQW